MGCQAEAWVGLWPLTNPVLADGVAHWSPTSSWDMDKDAFLSYSDGVSMSVVSAEVEMTAYALLTYTLLGDVAAALPVVKWLSQQRNALGGFSSTQTLEARTPRGQGWGTRDKGQCSWTLCRNLAPTSVDTPTWLSQDPQLRYLCGSSGLG
ncbi:C3 and PZP-like alpha-2-macroglobulin domain-containing protein 8 [Lemur catta]|uniref:C3 and PZP-like alpha-2-macroglobulin domain-containing protein 8 n=1 Tax=Lemur catta TaxID=9447 RepID=UPI001E2690F3|nr:C3 and PZP-like alpha-2-macroglobulin domain-containing protein 8 [Lemur catta]